MSSTVGFGPLDRIDGPPPAAPLYGLLQTGNAAAAGVRVVTDTDSRGIERWMNGVAVYPYPPDQGDVHDPCASGSDYAAKGDGAEVPNPEFGAMTLWLAETCTTYKVWSQEEFKARAVASFNAVESAMMAREFQNGTRLPANPYLADGVNMTFPNSDTVTTALNGLAYLEDAIAATGKQGLIHMPPSVAIALSAFLVIEEKGGVLRTINGTVVIPDQGYADGVSPVGHASATGTKSWIYATGPIDIRHSPAFVTPENVSQAVDRGSGGATTGKANSVTYRVERYALVTWDTDLHAAVLVDRCQTTCVAA